MQKIIAANWKMYKTRQEARETAAAVAAALNEQPTPHEVVVFAPFTAIVRWRTLLPLRRRRSVRRMCGLPWKGRSPARSRRACCRTPVRSGC